MWFFRQKNGNREEKAEHDSILTSTTLRSENDTSYLSWRSLIAISNEKREEILRTISSDAHHITLKNFGTTRIGLDENEASSRFNLIGPNSLSSSKPLSWWVLLFHVTMNPFNLLLAIIAIISVATPEKSWATFTILLIMILLSVGIRFWQEIKSSIAAIKLQSQISSNIQVLRQQTYDTPQGKETRTIEELMDKSNLVPGDIIILNSGDTIPADCLLLNSTYLSVTQSSLTGESEAVLKSSTIDYTYKDNEAIFDMKNLLFMDTVIVSGYGIALIVTTGDNTLISTITKELSSKRQLNAFEKGTRRLSYLMLFVMIIMVSIVLLIRGLKTKNWNTAALFALSVAVGIVPEMLPAIVNVNLARGAFVLSKKKAIVRKLDSIQNLGGMTILCSDKTGTLTQDEIILNQAEDAVGDISSTVLQLAFTNSINQSGKKNAIDKAVIDQEKSNEKLIVLGQRVLEIPFSFEKRRSSSVVKDDSGELILISKGAFEEILSLCTRVRLKHQVQPLTESFRSDLIKRVNSYNENGYRVLGCSTNELKPIDVEKLSNPEYLDEVEPESIFEGLLTFLDPPKEDAKESIAKLQEQGIEVKVLTGDNLKIAHNICMKLNLHGNDPELGLHSVTGPELSQLKKDDFDEMVKRCTIFAKLTPKQKGEVINSLKEANHVVGMLGDGINDCIALRCSDVGISVNTAVNVAKDCADIIMTEKKLSIIVDGVAVGRLTHGNTMKYIKMVTSSNVGNVLSVLIASAWLPYSPMLPIQIIIQNLLYDVSQTALPWDTMDAEYLTVPHAWDLQDLLRFTLVFAPTSTLVDVSTFLLNWYWFGVRSPAAPPLLASRAQTHWFLESLLSQICIVHLMRTAKLPFVRSNAAPGLFVTTSVVAVIGVALTFIPPVARLVSLTRPDSVFLGFLAAQIVFYCVEVQLLKMLYIRIFKRWI